MFGGFFRLKLETTTNIFFSTIDGFEFWVLSSNAALLAKVLFGVLSKAYFKGVFAE